MSSDNILWKITDGELKIVGIGDRILSEEEAKNALQEIPIYFRSIQFPIDDSMTKYVTADYPRGAITNMSELFGAIYNFSRFFEASIAAS